MRVFDFRFTAHRTQMLFLHDWAYIYYTLIWHFRLNWKKLLRTRWIYIFWSLVLNNFYASIPRKRVAIALRRELEFLLLVSSSSLWILNKMQHPIKFFEKIYSYKTHSSAFLSFLFIPWWNNSYILVLLTQFYMLLLVSIIFICMNMVRISHQLQVF